MKALKSYVENMGFKYVWHRNTIQSLLVVPKDKHHITKMTEVIYRFECDGLGCDEKNFGESSRTFGERFKECLMVSSPIYDYSNSTGHTSRVCTTFV